MRVLAIVKRIVNQFKRDKRTLALMMLAPLLLITLLNYMFNGSSVDPKIGVSGLSESMITALEDKDLDVKKYQSAEKPTKKIKHDDLDAFLDLEGQKLAITYENSDPSVTTQINAKLQGALMAEQSAEMKQAAQLLKQTMKQLEKSGAGVEVSKAANLTGEAPHMEMKASYVIGDKNTSYFDTIGPIFIGFFVFFFVFLIAGISFLRERTTGTLERLLTTPIRRFEIELGGMFS